MNNTSILSQIRTSYRSEKGPIPQEESCVNCRNLMGDEVCAGCVYDGTRFTHYVKEINE